MTFTRLCIIYLAAFFLQTGCFLPKIIILHDPLYADERAQLGRVYESQKKYDLAREQYRLALKKDPKHVWSWLLLGDLSYKLKDYKEAEYAYKKALRLQPENGDVCNNLSWTYLQQNKKLQKAEDLVRKAIALSPDHSAYYLDTLGVILLRLGRLQESIAALKESVDALPKDKPEFLAEAYEHLADAYKAMGDEENFKKSVESAQRYRILKISE